MTVSLPLELLTMILDDCACDKATLYSCIQLNKNWYGAAIQYLWASPFALLHKDRSYNNDKENCRRAEKLLTVFIECFTETSCVLDNDDPLDKRRSKRPLFDYSIYVKEINFDDVSANVRDWRALDVSSSLDIKARESNIYLMESITVKIMILAIRYCQQLQSICLTPKKPQICTQLKECFASTQELQQLRSLVWVSERTYKDVFDSIATVACNLESILINCHTKRFDVRQGSLDNVCKLIQAQHQLKAFTVECIKSRLSSILHLLNACMHSLQSITLNFVSLDSDSLDSESLVFPHLKTIKVKTFGDLTVENFGSIVKVGFPSLEHLIFEHATVPDEILKGIIKNYGSTLHTLSLGKTTLHEGMCKLILRACQNLKHLSIRISSKENAPSIAHLVSALPKLNSLALNNEDKLADDTVDVYFNNLANYKLPRLTQLELHKVVVFKAASLENLLSKSTPPLTKLIISNEFKFIDSYCDAILNYLSGTLKVLRVAYDERLKPSDEYIKKFKNAIEDFGPYKSDEKLHA